MAAPSPAPAQQPSAGAIIARQFFFMLLLIVSVAVSLTYLFVQAPTPTLGRHATIVLVWQGMRPDMVSATLTPRLMDFGANGSVAQDHHAVFPTTDLVNAAALATGMYPGSFAPTAATTPAAIPGDGVPFDAPVWLVGGAAPGPAPTTTPGVTATVTSLPADTATATVPAAAVTATTGIKATATPTGGVKATATPTIGAKATATPTGGVKATATPTTAPTATPTQTLSPTATVTPAPSDLQVAQNQIAQQRTLSGGLVTVPSLADAALRAGLGVSFEGADGTAIIQALSPVAQSAARTFVLDSAYTYPASLAGQLSAANVAAPGPDATATDLGVYFTQSFLRVVLPALEANATPYLSVIDYPDPAATAAATGLGSPATLSAIRADDQFLGQIVDALRAQHQDGNVNIVVTSDHGLNAVLAPGNASAADQTFSAPDPALRTNVAALLTAEAAKGPAGALPDVGAVGVVAGAPLATTTVVLALTGAAGAIVIPATPAVRAVAGGDLAAARSKLAGEIVAFLQMTPLIGPIFVNDQLPQIAGTLPLSALALSGPRAPDIAFGFTALPLDVAARASNSLGFAGASYAATDRLATSGGLSRRDLHTIFFAGGPSFKQHAVDPAPTGAIDLAPTLAAVLGVSLPNSVAGRAITELLVNGSDAVPNVTSGRETSDKAVGSDATAYLEVLDYEQVGATVYLNDAAAVREPATTPAAQMIQDAATLAQQE